MPIVRFEGSKDSIEVGMGSNLLRSLRLHDKPITALCLGLGLCGTDWIEVVQGADNLSPPSAMERLALGKPLKHGRRLACQVRVYGDCVLRLPDKAKASAAKRA